MPSISLYPGNAPLDFEAGTPGFTLVNLSGSTVYYGHDSSVSSINATGNVPVGSSQVLTGDVFLVLDRSGVRTQINLTDVSSNEVVRVISTMTTDIGPMVTPAAVPFHTGFFTPRSTNVIMDVDVVGNHAECNGSHTNISMIVGLAASIPLTPTAQAQALKAGAQGFVCGAIGGLPGALHYQTLVTGLQPGVRYAFELSCSIVGYAQWISLPDAAQSIACSAIDGVANLSSPTFGDCLVGITSATKLHVIRSNHFKELVDVLVSGAGIALTAGRTNGQVAMSPDLKRAIVTNYTSGSITVFDLTNPAVPVKVGADITTTATPLAVCYSADSSVAWLASEPAAAHPFVQKISTPGGTPSVGSAIDLGQNSGVNAMELTPDASKLVCFPDPLFATSACWIVNTSNNAVTTVTLPGALLQGSVQNNTTAWCVCSGGQLVKINLTAGTATAAGITVTNWIPAGGMKCFPDGNGAMVVNNSTSGGNTARQILFPPLGATPTEFVSWPGGLSGANNAVSTNMCINSRGTMFWANAAPSNYVTCYYGGAFFCRKSQEAFAGERAQVSFNPAN